MRASPLLHFSGYNNNQQQTMAQQPQQMGTGNSYGVTVDPYSGQQVPDNTGGYSQQHTGGYDDRSASYGGGGTYRLLFY